MFNPQRPHFPDGALRDALTYPQPSAQYSNDPLRQVLSDAMLLQLASWLDFHAAWGQKLSGGDQQRLTIARRLRKKPQCITVVEATAALDELAENTLYGKLQAHVLAVGGGTELIAHRTRVTAFHSKQWVLEKLAKGAAARHDLKESALPPAGTA